MEIKETGDGVGMVDITGKPPVHRTATATGMIKLKYSTVETIRSGRVKKGDVISTARIAAIMAVKDTPRMIPFCHQISITAVDVLFEVLRTTVRATVTVTSVGKTGVEMEALAGVSVALLNVWDMVKYLEKDETGNYPSTKIDDIRVVEKWKESSDGSSQTDLV
jgi:cyclic pyranopterin monophosphate synthase